MAKFKTNKIGNAEGFKDDPVKFLTLGSLGTHDPETSIVLKKGGYVDALVLEIKEAKQYSRVYKLKLIDEDGKESEKLPVILLGYTDLINQMGHGKFDVSHVVAEGDIIRVTYKGKTKLETGRMMHQFEIGVAE